MITLQTQPSPVTCVQTCLAMALGIPVEQVIEHYGAEPMNPKKLLHALTECGIEWSQQTLPTLMFSGFYFAVVPSLNHRGGFHQIILEYDAARGCNGMKIYDPAIGNRYKEDGSDILSWAELIGFWPGGQLPKAKLLDELQAERAALDAIGRALFAAPDHGHDFEPAAILEVARLLLERNPLLVRSIADEVILRRRNRDEGIQRPA